MSFVVTQSALITLITESMSEVDVVVLLFVAVGCYCCRLLLCLAVFVCLFICLFVCFDTTGAESVSVRLTAGRGEEVDF